MGRSHLQAFQFVFFTSCSASTVVSHPPKKDQINKQTNGEKKGMNKSNAENEFYRPVFHMLFCLYCYRRANCTKYGLRLEGLYLH